ncbi:MAG: AAA family ATPase [Candidatus Thorarchaeota archaeon]
MSKEITPEEMLAAAGSASLLAHLIGGANPRFTAKDVTIERSKDVKKIMLPEGMSYREGAKWLERKDEEEDKEVSVHHEIDCFPLDGAVAFRDSINEVYGYVQNVNTPGFFGSNPPTMVGVSVGRDEIRQIPWGRVEIPGIEGYLCTGLHVTDSGPKFMITGETKQRHLHEVEKIVQGTKNQLKTGSIYKGKAIKLDLSWIRDAQRRGKDPAEKFDPTGNAPKFEIPIDEIKEDELIFQASVQRDIDLGLFTPIENSEHCRRHGIPLKRGVLLAGDYGTGKTLTAYVTAKKATENGWTFIYLENVMDLAAAFKFAKQYSPAIIFAEDVDRVVGGDERTEEIDAVLNSFDGVDSKSMEIITVLTTNHLENLTQAILRPGRCDTLVQVTRPDAEAAQRLVKLYGRSLLNENADLDRIGESLKGHLPAEIREAVERSKLAAINRMTKSGSLPKDGSIRGEVMEQDVIDARDAMQSQHKLLEPKDVDDRSNLEKAASLFGAELREGVADRDGINAKAAISFLQECGIKAEDLNEVCADEDNDVSS